MQRSILCITAMTIFTTWACSCSDKDLNERKAISDQLTTVAIENTLLLIRQTIGFERQIESEALDRFKSQNYFKMLAVDSAISSIIYGIKTYNQQFDKTTLRRHKDRVMRIANLDEYEEKYVSENMLSTYDTLGDFSFPNEAILHMLQFEFYVQKIMSRRSSYCGNIDNGHLTKLDEHTYAVSIQWNDHRFYFMDSMDVNYGWINYHFIRRDQMKVYHGGTYVLITFESPTPFKEEFIYAGIAYKRKNGVTGYLDDQYYALFTNVVNEDKNP
ncbi:MAG TPA: hypothetical protein PLM90_11555 [Chitinophagales bacterium]|nr:hypothetical protein [Chitinophagales bacterium]